MAVLLVGLLAVGVVASIGAWQARLPDPAVADRDQLLRWLVLRDLDKESAQTRQTLARRLEEEFSADVDWHVISSQLDNAKRKHVWQNILLLLQTWFVEKADRYCNLANDQRTAYLDRLLDTAAAWQDAEIIRPQEDKSPRSVTGRNGLLGVLLEQTQRDNASPEQHDQVNQLLLAMQIRWLTRQPAAPATQQKSL
jgi:hypothetical protein